MKWLMTVCLVVLMAVTLAACGTPAPATSAPEPTAAAAEPTTVPATEAPTNTPEPTAVPTEVPTEMPTVTLPEGALVAAKAAEAPKLDGVGDETAWQDATEVKIAITGGANTSSNEIALKSVYTTDQVCFLTTWADPNESWLRAPWEKQPDGSWKRLADPNDKGGDNNLYYEDKLAFIWPISDTIKGFDTAGCFTACHAGENADVKPYGNKYTASAGEMGDIWHWKSVRNLNQIDDQYLDNTMYSKDTPEAGRKSDAKESGGYVNNETEDKKLPAFMIAGGGEKDGSPGYIVDSEKVPFDDTLFEAGDRLPAIIKSEIVGDRGDIAAGWQWVDGVWTLEFCRALDTGSPTDVQFTDLAKTYYFGVAAFDNAQVRHAFQAGATPFVFMP